MASAARVRDEVDDGIDIASERRQFGVLVRYGRLAEFIEATWQRLRVVLGRLRIRCRKNPSTISLVAE